jgi:hypothetical protein
MIQDWTEPNDIDDAMDRRFKLIAECEEIDAQLTDQTKKGEMGKDAWAVWRTKAIWAKLHRIQDLRLVNDWIRTY